MRAARHGQVVVGGREQPVDAHDAEAIDLQRDVRARCSTPATAPARWRSPRTRSSSGAPTRSHFAAARLHEPDAGPPRLPRDDGGLLPGQAAAVRRPSPRVAVVNVDDPYGRAPRGRDARTRSRSRSDAPADYRADDARERPRRLALPRARPTAPVERALRRCRAASTSPTRSARSPRRARSASTDDAIAAALARAGRVPGRFEPVDEGQDFAVLVDYAHTPDSLENVLRAARELAGAGACIVRVRRAAATATAASGR